MRTSDSIDKIAPAVVKAQAAIGAAHADSTNPFHKSKYASLSAIMDTIKPALAKHDLSILTTSTTSPEGHTLTTILMHSSSQWIASDWPVVANKPNDPQALGSAVTYIRRYSIAALLQIPVEDDDGNAAVRPQEARKATPNPRKAREHKTTDPDLDSAVGAIGPVRAQNLHRLLGAHGIPSNEHNEFAAALVKRPIEHLRDLSEDEARLVWETAKAGGRPPDATDFESATWEQLQE